MASRSLDEVPAFASIDRLRFDEDGGFSLDGRLLPDRLGARPYLFTCHDREGGVLAIVEVDVKRLLEIAPRD